MSTLTSPYNATFQSPASASLGFGRVFTEHMLRARYEPGTGWGAAEVLPYGPLTLDPATMALHYGQTVFEGLKAYRGVDGLVRLFRPRKYLERLAASARRLCIPPLDVETGLGWLLDFVRADDSQVPDAPGSSLYVRAFIFATDPYLGVRPSQSYGFCLIASPVGAYYEDEALSVLAEDRYVRAVEGGMGDAKTGGNYAASLLATEEAHAAGYTQVLWLDGIEHRYLEEAGTMNIMLRLGDEVVTPPLGGTILDGVTRDSVLALLRGWGVPVSERRVSIDEVVAAAGGGSLREVWGTGTAAGIAPVGTLGYQGGDYAINGGHAGELSRRLKTALQDLWYAKAPDSYGWMTLV